MTKLSAFLNAHGAAHSGYDWHATDPWVRFGNRVVVYFFGCMLLLSLVPISGAVVATGQVSVEGEYKAVQHLEGGIVSKILVKNGDAVKEGDILVKLDDTQAAAGLQTASAKVLDLSIQEARLLAERDHKDSFAPPEGVNPAEPDAVKIIQSQTTFFNTRRTAYLGQRDVLTQKISQAKSEVKSNESQLAARKKEFDLNQKELETVLPLFEKGYVNQQRVGPLQREAARLEGENNALKSDTTKLKASLAEMEARLAQTEKDFAQQSAEELQKVHGALAEQRELKKSLSDKMRRTEIRAPIGGRIHAIVVHTEGGVVPPGGPVLQIVPDGKELTVQARIQPHDIDKVHIAQRADLRFSSFDSHTTPRLKGKVRAVSAAEITDKDNKTYFTAEIEVPPEELALLDADQKLLPGMPAEVYLQTRSRTILSYFLKPLTDMLARTFRER